MDFLKCPRGVVRPKKKRFGAPNIQKNKLQLQETDIEAEAPTKKKRGRPAGSKNKPKFVNIDEPPQKKTKLTMRERAELAASVSLHQPSEVCNICNFNFNHELKRHIELTNCNTCNQLYHEPCLRKSGCIEC